MNEILSAVRRRSIPDLANSLLPICSRPRLPEELQSELVRRAGLVQDWDALLALAEEHGLGPLLFSHLADAGVDVPTDARRKMQAVYVRHQRSNEVLFAVLERLLRVFEEAQIDVAVLKGPALVELVYRDPGLRPIGDLDLLVAEGKAVQALRLLGEAGFDIRMPDSVYRMNRTHHMHAATTTVDGVSVTVEIHRDALSPDRGATLKLDGLSDRLMTLEMGERRTTVRTLGHDDMLWHLCRHMVGLKHPFRLVWVADIVGYAEAFVEELNWDYLRSTHPFVLSTLSLLDWLTPLPSSVRDRAGLATGAARLSVGPVDSIGSVGEDYEGWPRSTALTWNSWGERLEFLKQSVVPPDWWLRLNYGTGAGPGGYGRGVAKHSAALAGLAWRRAVDFVPRRDRPPVEAAG
jgi:hypothetical protein